MIKKDPFTKLALKQGYRARSAFKLKSLNKNYGLFKKGDSVLDLGCFPGGWMIVCKEAGAKVIGIDLEKIEEIKGAEFRQIDVYSDEVFRLGSFDVVISDLAPKTTGIREIDHQRSLGLCERALEIANRVLREKGNFLCKTFQGGETNILIKDLKKHFKMVKVTKPEASKKRSKEVYIIAKFKK